MPLDIDALYPQINAMVDALPEAESNHQLAEARRYLRRADPSLLRRKLAQREQGTKIPWLVAEPVDTLARSYPAPPAPPAFTVVAADGSSIPPDRHSPVRFYVLNIGQVALTYGPVPAARIEGEPRVCHSEQELYYDPQGKRIPIEGARLGIQMSVEELVGLLDAAVEAEPPVLALRDGSLILWQLQSRDEDQDFCRTYLDRFVAALEAFRQRAIPVASYISYPGSRDVANSLRLMLCDNPAGCSHCAQDTDERALCRFVGTLLDQHLFQGLLEEGARSDLYLSQSAILTQYGAQHRVLFFYLNVGGEIARIEAPAWVMEDAAMRDLVHALVYDQCRRSAQYPPYPPALIEAHERAVISTADRQVVEELTARALASKGYLYIRSAKDRSKRSRGV
ncbi:MAG: DNA double-strand break repair nuclease NurA [Anaerolineae bacterium]|nr:DNA double-strand break repair nuclease NurA [Anaerolineae bacterium]